MKHEGWEGGMVWDGGIAKLRNVVGVVRAKGLIDTTVTLLVERRGLLHLEGSEVLRFLVREDMRSGNLLARDVVNRDDSERLLSDASDCAMVSIWFLLSILLDSLHYIHSDLHVVERLLLSSPNGQVRMGTAALLLVVHCCSMW